MAKKENILLDFLGLASLVCFGWASYQLYKLTKREGGSEEKSSVSGLKTMTYTLTNNTDKKQVEYLFDSRSRKDNPNVGIQPSMDFFNNELSNKPKKLMKVEFRNIGSSNFSNVSATQATELSDPTNVVSGDGGTLTGSSISPAETTPVRDPIIDPIAPPTPLIASQVPIKNNQAEAPFKMNCADASGDSSSKQYIPLISANQYQGGITSVKFDGKILDGGCYMAYTMLPKSKVAIVLYYEDIPHAIN